ncbi:MAG: FAD-dependent oxidoreductase [Alphaproteobacteria bacterium]
MKSHTRVAVIGGGILGVSTIFHLTRLGWSDVVLIEKAELTAGSTWHAAGMVPGFAECALIARIMRESMDTYLNLEELTGAPSGAHRCGSIRLAHNRDEEDENKRFLGIARQVGTTAEIIGAQRVRDLYPLLETRDVKSALWLPDDCYTDPSQTTQGLARKARERGAEIYRHTKVTSLTRTQSGEWRIETDKGTVTAGAVVNCAGMWAKEISALVGGTLPAVSIEHEFLVTETIPEIAPLSRELPMLWDMSVPMYTRSDRKGLIVSCYEDHPKFFGVEGIPPQFGQELLPPDLERTEHRLLQIQEMIPALKTVGIKTVVNGPTPRSPDMRPLIGPAHGYDNFYVMCGVSGGFLFSSATRYLAEWIVEGQPSINLAPFDVNRFGPYADKYYAVQRLSSGHAFASAAYYPHVEAPEGRPCRTTPIYDRLKSKGAVFGAVNGWEVPNWFAPKGEKAEDAHAYERTNWHPHVAAEIKAIREGVGILDWSSTGKFELAGAKAAPVIERLSAGKMPKIGDFAPAPFLNTQGRMASLLHVGQLADDRFYLVGWPIDAARDAHWLSTHAGDADFADVSTRWGILALLGPKAAAVLKALDLDHASLPVDSVVETRLSNIPIRLVHLRAGETPIWGIHHPIENQIAVYEALTTAGKDHGIRDVGFRAYEMIRLEVGVPMYGLDYWMESDPNEVGLGDLLRANGDFLGREALAKRKANSKSRRLVRLEIAKGARPVDPWGDEPVAINGTDVGAITSGGYAHGRGTSMAFAMVDTAQAKPGTALEVEILGDRYVAKVI